MKNPRKINLIVVHCSATRVNQDFPVEALEACHKARGFRSIGYDHVDRETARALGMKVANATPATSMWK